MAELLLELLSEEIPARMQARAAEDLQRLVLDGIAAGGIVPGQAKTFVTPRRLTLLLQDVPVTAADVREEKRGPRVGAPAAALDGFLKSTGLTVEHLEQRDTGKGVFYFAVIERPGRAAADVILETVNKALAEFPWPKSMRWGHRPERWVRPLQSILCLFEDAVIPVSFATVTAGDSTVGHRFLAPARFSVANFADYQAKLRAAFVQIDASERRAAILSQAEAKAAELGLSLRQDDGLLAEVTGLVEWPTVLSGAIDDAFMDVPDEVLMTSMRSHQKYFSLLKADGRLANRFLVVSNMVTADGGAAIVAGNERVLRARLSDAKFFWDTDRQIKLQDRVPALADRLFYAQLGTLEAKVERLKLLAKHLTLHVGDVRPAVALRAAHLAKADLSSEMVGEFPELQGVIGRYYALNDGESAEVADAIADHYAPAGPGDRCPTAPTSIAVALADRIDSLVGFFAINERPTGSKDPFALRRAALGIIRLILENRLRLPLRNYLELGHAAYLVTLPVNAADTATAIMDFIADRLKVHLREQGVRHDLVAAVFALGSEDDLVRLLARVDALKSFLSSDDGANLVIAYRRAANIVRIEEKKDGTSYSGKIDPSLFATEQEDLLYRRLEAVQGALITALHAEKFEEGMAQLAKLRAPLDAFFADVTVNCDDAAVRVNRLRLLARIDAAMRLVADVAKIEG